MMRSKGKKDAAGLGRAPASWRVRHCCTRPTRTHVKAMSRHQFSPETRDLFGAVQPPASRRSGPTRPSARQACSAPKLPALSNAELAVLLTDLVRELQRRAPNHARSNRPDLERAVR